MIIGLLGFAGSGKGTVGEILNMEYDYIPESVAKPVKDAAAAIFGWPRSCLEGDTERSRNFRERKDEWWSNQLNMEITPRKVLQLMGTEVFRNIFHPDIWIKSLQKRIEQSSYKNIYISDVRFPNEVKAIREMNGKVVLIERGEKPEWWAAAEMINSGLSKNIPPPPVHFSEWAWIGTKMDYTIQNNGTFDDLSKEVNKMIDFFASM